MTRLPATVAADLILAYEQEYRELCGNWSSLEKKAHLVGGTVLALLTGGLALLARSLEAQPTVVVVGLVLFAVALFGSATFSWRALQVGSETVPVPGEKLRALARELESPDADTWARDFHEESLNRKVVFWDEACSDLYESVQKKGAYVATSQWMLLAATVCAFLSFLWLATLQLTC